MPLQVGVTLPKDMDQRQFARWCKQQAITADENTVATDTIQDSAVTLGKMADLVANRIIGRITSDGVPQALTPGEVAAMIQTALQILDWTHGGEVTFADNVGFFNATPVAQQTTPSTLSLATVSGTGDDSDINTNFAAIQSAVNAIKTALDNFNLTG